LPLLTIDDDASFSDLPSGFVYGVLWCKVSMAVQQDLGSMGYTTFRIRATFPFKFESCSLSVSLTSGATRQSAALIGIAFNLGPPVWHGTLPFPGMFPEKDGFSVFWKSQF
jgi:hypothetical protein